ncbi:hypothetical protein DC965_27265, partial [Escherichia coli]|nr:hypothetical protein [Escherichia coli O157:H7]EFI9364707.1 hypothetical protein [Escherichia coli]EFJ3978088.1 hypothetical protein [Escherichia coli]EFN9951630.1 hypothetical protein [Escherichia coli]EFO4115118.1 hypothetical protein [Escherichia coli]
NHQRIYCAAVYYGHKKTTFRWLPCAKKTCVSPRDTALRSIQELKQFMCKNARTFLKLHQPFHQFISANNKPTIGSRQFQP